LTFARDTAHFDNFTTENDLTGHLAALAYVAEWTAGNIGTGYVFICQ
jgi:hypothetical protein